MNPLRYRSQVLIIGSGLAGCAAALTLADKGMEVHMLVPTEELDGGNSAMAQGGSYSVLIPWIRNRFNTICS